MTNPRRSEIAVLTAIELGCPILPYFHSDLELQIDPFPKEERYELFGTEIDTGYPIRIPKNADSDPIDNDDPMNFHPKFIMQIGTTGWDWRKRQSLIFGFDADSIIGHIKEGLADAELARLIEAARKLPYVQINKSKGGLGCQLWVVLRDPVATQNHTEHGALGKAILKQMSEETGYDFVSKIDAKATNMWIASRKTKTGGFEIVKEVTAPLDRIPQWEVPKPAEAESSDLDEEHQRLLGYLQAKGKGEWEPDEKRLQTHTLVLKQAHSELGLKGEFETSSSGSTPRNCFAYARPNGAWFVVRHSQGVNEAETWHKSDNGWTCCDFNKKPDAKGKKDDQRLFEMVLKTDELFCSKAGDAFVTFTLDGKRLTMRVEEEDYGDCLRNRFEAKFHRLITDGHLNNAVRNIRARAKQGQRYDIKKRVARHRETIYLNLANDKGELVEITANGWNIVKEAPVRFWVMPDADALPVPSRHGNINLMRPFCRCRDEDWPLVVGWLVAALRPEGPYTDLSTEGQPGTAKSSLTRFCKWLIDPTTDELTGEPASIEDLMLQAYRYWVVAYDNLSKLDKKMSDALCLVSTGGSHKKRKLYTTEGVTTFNVKNPVVISSVEGVIVQRDLIDRSLLITMPPLADGERKEEDELNAEFIKLRPAILGALCDGVASALKNLSKVPQAAIADIRMKDFARWVTAAEPGLGWKQGTIMAAYRRMRLRASETVIDSPLGKLVEDLADENYCGTATDIADRLGLPKTDKMRHKQVAGELRMMADDFKRRGVIYKDRPLNGRTVWDFCRAEAAKVA